LRIIQIGITFGNCARNLCFPCCLWQFNFRFSQSENLNNSDAVRLLENANIDFSKFESNRIEQNRTESNRIEQNRTESNRIEQNRTELMLLTLSLCCSHVVWLWMKKLSGSLSMVAMTLHLSSRCWRSLLFPTLLWHQTNYVRWGVEDWRFAGPGNGLDIQRFGIEHQAGYDSYMTLLAFYRMIMHYGGVLRREKFKNVLYDLGRGIHKLLCLFLPREQSQAVRSGDAR
jgi:hypothetical protein